MISGSKKKVKRRKKGIADTSKLQCETTVTVNREDMRALWSQKKIGVAAISKIFSKL